MQLFKISVRLHWRCSNNSCVSITKQNLKWPEDKMQHMTSVIDTTLDPSCTQYWLAWWMLTMRAFIPLCHLMFDVFNPNSMCSIINMTVDLFDLFQASFPGNLHLVLVLRPTSFFHRTVTDIGFRFSQEDFMLKMPVRQLLLSYQTCPTSQQGTTRSRLHPGQELVLALV